MADKVILKRKPLGLEDEAVLERVPALRAAELQELTAAQYARIVGMLTKAPDDLEVHILAFGDAAEAMVVTSDGESVYTADEWRAMPQEVFISVMSRLTAEFETSKTAAVLDPKGRSSSTG